MWTMTPAPPDQHHRLGREFFEAQDRLRGGPDPALVTPGYSATLGGNPAMPLAGHTGFAQGFDAGFPDAHHHIEDVIAADQRIAVRLVITGTHTGNFFGIPPTGKPVRVATQVIMHVEGGKVGRLFGLFDEAGLLRQLGVLTA